LRGLIQARHILRRPVDADPGTPRKRFRRINYDLAGKALARMGRWQDAEEKLKAGASILGETDDSLALSGRTLWKGGRAAEAMAAFVREGAKRQRPSAGSAADPSYRNDAANVETDTAAALATLGGLAEARAYCDRAIAAREDLLKGDPNNDLYAQGLAESLMRSASVRSATGDAPGAAANARRAASLYATHPPLWPEWAISRACCHGLLASLAGKEGSGVAAAEEASQADEAMVILHQAFAGGYRDADHLRVEPGLDPLRSRDDFHLLMSDQTFPAEPFATAR
jgi:hypothetical protein